MPILSMIMGASSDMRYGTPGFFKACQGINDFLFNDAA